ncbi:GspH/FimT family pseudopilin [Pseudoalteromonas sp.]|uniref:GspH/FimT family pseudopilin n=1 Tax=Pseudoalteromonas sp. TaxID=53249 RepID=UPI00356830D3
MKKIQQGFTILELMVTVAIVGIVATIALWNSSDMLEDNRAENFLLELKRNITYARSQAASTDSIVVVCPAASGDVATSKATLNCRNEWGAGSTVILFVDGDRDGNYDADSDSLLRVMSDTPSSDKVKYDGNVSRLSFNATGRLISAAGDFIYCPNNDNKNNKALTVSQSGTSFFVGDTAKTCS